MKVFLGTAAALLFTLAVSSLTGNLDSFVLREFLPRQSALVAQIPLPERTAQAPGFKEASKETVPAQNAFCSFATTQAPFREKLIFSEIAWMGSFEGYQREWFELENISREPLDLTGFQIVDAAEQIRVTFPLGVVVPPNERIVLERGKDVTVPHVTAAIVYEGALSNTNEGLRLFDPACRLLDEVLAYPNWPAGDVKSKRTMERNRNDFSWYTSSEVGGTPGAGSVPRTHTPSSPQDRLASLHVTSGAAPRLPQNPEVTEQQKEVLQQPPLTPDAVSKKPGPQELPKPSLTLTMPETVTWCPFDAREAPTHHEVVINEVAWMGSLTSAAGEWIELRSIGAGDIGLAGWQLLGRDNKVRIRFDKGTMLPRAGFYLLERSDDTSVSGVTADKIYTGALLNSNEALRLFDGSCRLIDEVLADPNWPAGDNASKKTMERKLNLEWQTSLAPGGTPRTPNSEPWYFESGSSGLAPSLTASLVASLGQSTSTATSSNPNEQLTFNKGAVVISEVMYDLPGSDDGREWLEVLNMSTTTIDLSLWKFFENNTNHKLNLVKGSSILPGGGYAVIADDSAKFLEDHPTYAGTLFDSSFSLSNTGEALALKFGESVIDEVSYDTSMGGSGDGSSLGRFGNTWQRSSPTPGVENRAAEEAVASNPTSSSSSNLPTQSTSTSQASSSSEPITPLPIAVSHIVIAEVQITGVSGKADNDFVKLYNPTTGAVDISNWNLRKRIKSGTESSIRVFPGGSVIQSLGYFTWANSKNAFDVSVGANTSSTQTLTDNSSIALFNNQGDLVDALAWGSGHTNPFQEGMPYPENPGANQVLKRKFVEGVIQDTDNNADDFEI